ncbi:MAG: hypothetical protein PUF31_07455 [Oscillospiraceae bacterium]|nr:hypothetical protein [Oscillospiraceae bacterium]MDD6527616.1 hypothetical protein [Oscillospiraceae bacterium]
MGEKKFDFKAAVHGAGKNASELFGKAKDAIVRAADQNDDGKFDKEDVSTIADTVGETVKIGAQTIKESAEEKSRLIELKLLQPIFIETIDDADFLMPKFIRITERDKRRSESEVCKGSIGYFSDQKGLRIVNIFRDSIETFGLSFCPDNSSEFYYVDPSDRDRYIALDEYFNYLKSERISELQMIAKSLGAKHFKVTYKEEQTAFTERKIKGNMNVKGVANADTEHSHSERKYSTVEIAAQLDCPGHEPIKPQLKYLQRDPNIKTLIAMRMDERAPLSHHELMIQLSNSSGIKESDAIKIDAVLKGMKLAGNTSVASEAKNESRRYLEYEIDF